MKKKKITLWVARDENGVLWIYTDKPRKKEKYGWWVNGDKGQCMYYDDELGFFKNVKWEDKYPSPIEIEAL